MKNSIVLSEARSRLAASLVAKFIVPGWGDNVGPYTGLSHQPARLHRLEGTTFLCQSHLYPSVMDYEFSPESKKKLRFLNSNLSF
jgi:hypothetical protein